MKQQNIEIKRFKHKEEYWLKNIIVQQQLTKNQTKKINKNPYFSEKSSNCCAPLSPPPSTL
jgi:hypothetical protein